MTDLSWKIWVDPVVGVALLGIAGGAIGWVWRKLLRPILNMAKDWHGTEARPGVPERKGIMVRLAEHDQMLELLTKIAAELSPNGGKSVRDRVEKIARSVGADDDR